MEYALYIAAVAALLACVLMYRRRKVQKPVDSFYCDFSVPPGGDPAKDGIRLLRRKPPKPVHRCNCFFAIPPSGDPVDDFMHFYRSDRPD